MPILWRYLLSQYLKIFSLVLVAFVVILLTMRLGDIAHFAALGAEGKLVVQFVLYQIPYILPIAIPISSLIASTLTFRELSQTHQITALLSSGFSLFNLLLPIMIASSFLAFANFIVISEVATSSHLAATTLKSELRSVNPLLLLHNKHLLRMRGIFFDNLGPSSIGKSAEDVIIAFPSNAGDEMNLVLAKKLQATPTSFLANSLTFISPFQNSLMIENMKKTKTASKDFSELIHKKVISLKADHLRLPLLMQHISGSTSKKEKQIGQSEILRRVSVALALITFPLMGALFGIYTTRNDSAKKYAFIVILAAIYISCFFLAKGLHHHFQTALFLYFSPHLLILICSLLRGYRITQGVAR